jgi:hypothetical protein
LSSKRFDELPLRFDRLGKPDFEILCVEDGIVPMEEVEAQYPEWGICSRFH